MNKTASTETDTSSEVGNAYIPEMNLQKIVKEMSDMARMLVPHTYPLVDFQEEQDVMFLKQRHLAIDGYDLIICLSEADYGESTLISLQIQSAQGPFLPFALICKIGRAFLGEKHLSFIEFFRNNKKVYCWTIKKNGERLMRPAKSTKAGSYEGFDFRILHPGSVDLF